MQNFGLFEIVTSL